MQALFDIFKSISLLFLAHFTNQFSNSLPAAQSRSRICLCILGDDVVILHHLRGCRSKEKKKETRMMQGRQIACLFLKLRFLFNLQDPH